MPLQVCIPDMGTTVDYVMIERWRVQIGDRIRRGDILADVQTDKATAELESVAEGVVLALLVNEGQNINVGEPCVLVGQEGEELKAVDVDAPAQVPGDVPVLSPLSKPPKSTPEQRVRKAPRAETNSVAMPVAQAVKNLAAKLGVDLSSVQGTGTGARITRADVLAASKAAQEGAEDRSDEDPHFLLSLYRQMLLIRHFEERVKFLFLEGKMPGTIHQCQGQEAVGVGICAALREDDVITSTHRPHGHAIAKGVGVEPLLHELFGKKTGCCGGKGGSMHVGDLARGMVPAIAIVGGNVPLATGVALAFKMRHESRVAVCFMGDGAINEGAFHEAVNMAAIWRLPVVYVVENNLYAASTPVGDSTALEKLSDRARGYGIPGITVDGNDVLEVYRTAADAVGRARAGEGPTLIDAITYRITGHSRRDPCNYQPEDERRVAKEREPIGRFARVLLERGTVRQTELDELVKDVDREIEAAVESAMSAEDPEPSDALNDLYA